MFVAFEGGDGAGKSTQIAALQAWLEAQGREVTSTFEPGEGALGAAIRRLLLHSDAVAARAEALLFAADRAQHVETVVRPALARGSVVLTDRYLDSSIAYQGAGRDLLPEDVRGLSLWATAGLLPDLTVLLDLDPALGRGRRGSVHDRLESEPADFHERVRAGYLELARADPARYAVIDAALAPGQIQEQIRTVYVSRVVEIARVAPRRGAGEPSAGDLPQDGSAGPRLPGGVPATGSAQPGSPQSGSPQSGVPGVGR